MGRYILSLFVAVVVFYNAPTATAGTATGTLGVSATVVSGSIISVGSISFGTQDAGAVNIDANAGIVVNVANGQPYTVALDGGTNPVGANRFLKDAGANTIQYNLYSDAYVTTWGINGAVSSTGSAMDQTLTVYGRIPNMGVNDGSFTDAVTVTLTY